MTRVRTPSEPVRLPVVGAGVLSLALVLAVTVETWNPDALVADVCYLAVVATSAAAAWIGAARWPRDRRLAPRLVAAALSLNALGEIIWTALTWAGEDPQVSIADVAWVASYVLLGAALWKTLDRSHDGARLDLDFALDAVSVVVVSLLVVWHFSVQGIVSDDSVPAFTRMVWASYPVLDAICLALVVRVLLSARGRAAIDPWFAVGISIWLAADLLYLRAPDDLAVERVMNAAWMLAPVLIARAAWRVPPVVRNGAQASTGYVGKVALATCPLVVPPALALTALWGGQGDALPQLLVGTVVVSLLAVVRAGRLVHSEHLSQRELASARDAALAASEAKSMFLANVSHELRTPLTLVLATTELLNATELDRRQRTMLEMMDRSGARLRLLVEDLLDFSRLEADRVAIDHEPFDLAALVDDVTETHRPAAAARGIGFSCYVDDQLPDRLIGDAARIRQVLDNLLDNAVKFTATGRVALTATVGDAPSGGVTFSVIDTGIGIAPGDQNAVFEPFHQVDASATRRYSGTGLGLAICANLVELMRGSIEVDSELGEGSAFTVRLPLQPAHPVAQDPPGSTAPQAWAAPPDQPSHADAHVLARGSGA